MPSGTFLPPGITTSNVKISTGGSDNQVLTAVDGETAQGEANLTFDGSTLTVTGAVTVGSAGSGHDVQFFSSTSGDHMLWDASEEKLVIVGTDGANALEVTDGNVAITDDLTVTGNISAQSGRFVTSSTGTSAQVLIGAHGTYNAVINAPESVYINIDSNNGQSDREFTIAHDADADGSVKLFSVNESAIATLFGTASSGSDTALVFDGEAKDYHIGLHDTGDNFVIGASSTVGTNPFLRVFASGVQPYQMLVGGTGTSSGASTYAVGVAFLPIVTSHSGDSANVSLVSMGSQISGANSLVTGGNTSVAATLYLKEPDISTSHTITSAATLYIEDAPTEATNDYALWVDTGASRFDGIVLIGQGTDTGFATGADNLIVGDGSNHEGMTIFTGNNSIGSISFADAADPDGYSGYIQYGHGTQGEKLHFGAGGGLEMTLTSAGILFLGGETANANMTTGLTINQGGAGDEILAFKSSDVSHSLTSETEADTFAMFKKLQDGTGGLNINGFKESGEVDAAVVVTAMLSEAADTTNSTSGRAVIEMDARINSSGSGAAVANDGNIFAVRNGGNTTRLLVEGNGDLHGSDTSIASFDTYDDAQLIRALEQRRSTSEGSKGFIKSKWDDFVKYGKEELVRAGVISDPVEGDPMLNISQLLRLHNGAIWQGYTREMEQQERIEKLERRLLALEGGK